MLPSNLRAAENHLRNKPQICAAKTEKESRTEPHASTQLYALTQQAPSQKIKKAASGFRNSLLESIVVFVFKLFVVLVHLKHGAEQVFELQACIEHFFAELGVFG